MAKLTLKNDFHGTEVTLKINLGASNKFTLSTGQVEKAQKALCGIDGCTCSGYTGARGGDYEIDGQVVNLSIEHNQDTSAVIIFEQFPAHRLSCAVAGIEKRIGGNENV